MKIYDNEMSDAAKGEIEQSGENFLFAENVPFEKRLSIGYKLSLKTYGYSLESEPRLDRTIFSVKKIND